MRNDKENVVVKLSFQFALKIIEFSEQLEQERKYVVARQLLKSGTSIGANIHEAQNAESKADFIHKMKIAAKEADETMYWILICEEAPLVIHFSSRLKISSFLSLRFYQKLLVQQNGQISNYQIFKLAY